MVPQQVYKVVKTWYCTGNIIKSILLPLKFDLPLSLQNVFEESCKGIIKLALKASRQVDNMLKKKERQDKYNQPNTNKNNQTFQLMDRISSAACIRSESST